MHASNEIVAGNVDLKFSMEFKSIDGFGITYNKAKLFVTYATILEEDCDCFSRLYPNIASLNQKIQFLIKNLKLASQHSYQHYDHFTMKSSSVNESFEEVRHRTIQNRNQLRGTDVDVRGNAMQEMIEKLQYIAHGFGGLSLLGKTD